MDRRVAIKDITDFRMSLMPFEEKEKTVNEEGFDVFFEDETWIMRYNDGESPITVDYFVNELLSLRYYGIKNSYIENEYNNIFKKEIYIDDIPETLYPCPCCNYLTIEDKWDDEICPVCFWQDDGGYENNYSSANKMFLRDGKENYLKYGCMDIRFINNIEKNPDSKYEKLV